MSTRIQGSNFFGSRSQAASSVRKSILTPQHDHNNIIEEDIEHLSGSGSDMSDMDVMKTRFADN
jgi:hypothetical protein